MALPDSIASRLRLPLIAAPMTRVSGLDLVRAACRLGVIGAFPLNNARTVAGLDEWLGMLNRDLAPGTGGVRPAPYAVNLIMRRADIGDWIACVARNHVEMVITSVGSPKAAIGPLHDVGCLVFSDVASMKHAEKAIEAGVDGLILLCAGAAGQTGWANPFAYARAVRRIYDGTIVLAGGIADGASLWAARQLGCDLAYMGTRFVAVSESLATDRYRDMLIRSSLDDVLLTTGVTGLPGNFLRESIAEWGLDPDNLPAGLSAERMAEFYGNDSPHPGPKRYTDILASGHSVSGVTRVQSVAELVEQTSAEYEAARRLAAALP